MSMNNYPLKEIAFLVDEEAAAYISLSIDKKEDCVPPAIAKIVKEGTFVQKAKEGSLPDDYGKLDSVLGIADFLCYCSEFDGSASTLLPENTENPLDVDYEDDLLLYIPTGKAADLFSAPYATHDELLQEFQNNFSSLGVSFPDDFDWWAHIVVIEGTYFC